MKESDIKIVKKLLVEMQTEVISRDNNIEDNIYLKAKVLKNTIMIWRLLN